jgi:hypothetical protein
VHIYNRINQATNQDVNVGADSLPENVRDVIDEVMEYEPTEVVPDINDHVFDGGDEKSDDDDDESITGLLLNTVQKKPCLLNLQVVGWEAIDKVKVKEVRQHAKDRLSRKSEMMKYIMLQVIEMKSSSGDISICGEKTDAEEAMWTNNLTELRPEYYN